MSKSERRTLLKSVYPKACAGDLAAILTLATLCDMLRRRSQCWICGQTIWTLLPRGNDTRCMVHRRSNLSMRERMRLK